MKLKPLGYGLTCYLFFSFSCHQYFCSTLDEMFFTGHDLGLYSLFVSMWYMGYFLLACIITHALSVLTQMSAINCLYESYKLFWNAWLWFSSNFHENLISVNKKMEISGEIWELEIFYICTKLAQGHHHAHGLVIRETREAPPFAWKCWPGSTKNLPDSAWAQLARWDGTVQDGTRQGCSYDGPSQSVQLFWRGRVLTLMNQTLSTSPMGHKRGTGYYLF